jgi:hypothetical protein
VAEVEKTCWSLQLRGQLRILSVMKSPDSRFNPYPERVQELRNQNRGAKIGKCVLKPTMGWGYFKWVMVFA